MTRLMNCQINFQEDHYKLLLNSAAEGIFEIDVNGNCVFCNNAAMRMLGYLDQSEIIGRNMHKLIHYMHEDKTDFPVGECKICKSFINGTDQHAEDEVLWTKDGDSFPVEYWSYPIKKDGAVIGSIVTFLDISLHRNDTRALMESERRLKGVIEGTNVGTWEWNIQTGETVFNEKWAEIVGYELEELAPVSIETWNHLAHPEDLKESEAQLRKLFVGKIAYYDLECRMKHKNGQWIWVHDRGKVIEWTKDGMPLIAAGTHTNINARKGIEAELKENESRLRDLNATKDKFLSIIAHDLRSPFNTIVGFSELLLDKIKAKDYTEIESFAQNVLNSSRNTLNLLSNLLEWSRSQTHMIALIPEYFDLGTLIDEILTIANEAANQKKISITKILPSETMIFADRHMIETVIRNLLTNAIKYTNSSGKVIIYVKNISGGISVEIKDDGVGIKKEKISRLFRMDESFSTPGTRNETGTGLGLLLCKEFIEKHGGKIEVKSEIGKGSTFSILIPSQKSNLIN